MTEAVSQQTGADTATEYATIQFIVQSILSRAATATLVRVDSCTNTGGLSPWGTVSVQPIVSQVSGNNVAVQHGKLFRLPYLRLQGGANAVIIDPQPGDIGLAVFCARDISSLKKQGNIDQIKAGNILGVPPGSGRQYNMADGIYLGGMLNGVPSRVIRFHSSGIDVESPDAVTIRSPSITLDGNVHVTGLTTGDGDATFNGTSVHTHAHSGVTSGGNNTGPPV